MRTIEAEGDILYLGRQGENLALRVRFPVTVWADTFGSGSFALVAQRAGDAAPYPVDISVDESYVNWDVTSADTAAAGLGHCLLLYYADDGTVAKSRTMFTKVAPSLDDAGADPPEAWESWVNRVLTACKTAENIAEAAAHMPIIERDTWWLWNSDEGVYEDSGYPARGEQGPQGEQGEQGEQGADGADGATPVRGTDYWTAEDQAEIVAAVAALFTDVSMEGQ
ncbi:MAG: hypothetical protein LUE95_02100 [Oscillospiraceae bacterium]|nr:hypothetical protein [Oscillospiraceae bacterium]